MIVTSLISEHLASRKKDFIFSLTVLHPTRSEISHQFLVHQNRGKKNLYRIVFTVFLLYLSVRCGNLTGANKKNSVMYTLYNY